MATQLLAPQATIPRLSVGKKALSVVPSPSSSLSLYRSFNRYPFLSEKNPNRGQLDIGEEHK
jgi:hypothetical protein